MNNVVVISLNKNMQECIEKMSEIKEQTPENFAFDCLKAGLVLAIKEIDNADNNLNITTDTEETNDKTQT